jgi:hypothetical protein
VTRTYRRLENRVYAFEEAGWRALSASLKSQDRRHHGHR